MTNYIFFFFLCILFLGDDFERNYVTKSGRSVTWEASRLRILSIILETIGHPWPRAPSPSPPPSLSLHPSPSSLPSPWLPRFSLPNFQLSSSSHPPRSLSSIFFLQHLILYYHRYVCLFKEQIVPFDFKFTFSPSPLSPPIPLPLPPLFSYSLLPLSSPFYFPSSIPPLLSAAKRTRTEGAAPSFALSPLSSFVHTRLTGTLPLALPLFLALGPLWGAKACLCLVQRAVVGQDGWMDESV